MFRISSILIIFIAGLILLQYQFFHQTSIAQSVQGNAVYQSLHNGINELTGELSSIIKTLVPVSSENQMITSEPEIPQMTEEVSSLSTSSDRIALTAENILYYTNLERTKRGLKPLTFNAKLTRSANAKNNDMFAFNYFAHESPIDTTKTFAYFIDNESYPFVRVSENLAMGDFTTAKSVVTAWMDSPTHRANILFDDYRDIGASVKHGTFQGKPTVMIVQHFGIPKTACPSISISVQTSLEVIEQEALTSKQIATDLETKMNEKGVNWTDEELNEMIGVYNTTIRKYNKLVETFQKISNEYNAQVSKYDQCIKSLN